MSNDLKSKFEKEIATHDIFLQKLTRIFNLLGYLRIAVLLVSIGMVYLMFSHSFEAVYCVVSAVVLIILVLLWIYHASVHERVDYHKSIIAINNKHIERVNGDWINFSDIGEEFIDKEHTYASDLDIVGKKSLFQMLNISNTWHGRRSFANDLMFAGYDSGELHHRQEAIKELSSDIEFFNNILHYTSKIGVNESIQELINQLDSDKSFFNSKILKNIFIFFPVISCIFIAAVAIFQLKGLYIVAFAFAAAQCLAWVFGIPKIYSYLGAAASFPYKLGGYVKVIEILQNRNFKSSKLNEIKQRLVSSEYSAAKAVKELYGISNKINFRHNGAIYFILNIFLLWDYECSFMLEKWKKKYGRHSSKWFEAIGEFESLLSFSGLANICGNVCFPIISESVKTIEAVESGHPLIPGSARINNGFTMKDNIIVISGSNMSGKTTFLRTIGINLVLANAGSYVCAKSFAYSPFEIMTSMRIADDLTEGISTFYAELKRIKKIIERARDNADIIFLIDEIFRGTNSVDRMYGAKTVLENFNELNICGMITTHDLDLCELAKEYSRIKNYSFSEYYENDAIHFDYKIKSGKSLTTNARYLMEMIGIYGR